SDLPGAAAEPLLWTAGLWITGVVRSGTITYRCRRPVAAGGRRAGSRARRRTGPEEEASEGTRAASAVRPEPPVPSALHRARRSPWTPVRPAPAPSAAPHPYSPS